VQTIRAFSHQLKKIEAILSKIDPIIMEFDEYNERLGHSRNEIDLIKDLFLKDKRLVEKCSRIHYLSFWNKYRHSKKLTKFDAKLVRELQIYMPPLNLRMNGEILWEAKEMKLESIPINPMVGPSKAGSVLQSTLQFLRCLISLSGQ